MIGSPSFSYPVPDSSAALAALVNGAPTALDTLNELAAALGNDANFASTVTTALAAKLAKSALGTGVETALGVNLGAAGALARLSDILGWSVVNVASAASAQAQVTLDDVFTNTYDWYQVLAYGGTVTGASKLEVVLRSGAHANIAPSSPKRYFAYTVYGSSGGNSNTSAGVNGVPAWLDSSLYPVRCTMTFYRPHDNTYKNWHFAEMQNDRSIAGQMDYGVTAAATGIALVSSSGNVTAGTKLIVLGLKLP